MSGAERLGDYVLIRDPAAINLIASTLQDTLESHRRNGIQPREGLATACAVVIATAADLRSRTAVARARQMLASTDPDAATFETSAEVGAAQAAFLLGLSTRTVQRLAADLGGRQVSGRWIFARHELEERKNT